MHVLIKSIIFADMEEWIKELQQQFDGKAICNITNYREFVSKFKTKEDAINFYKRGINWALKENFPTIDNLRSEFMNFHKDGLYVDHHFTGEELIDHQAYVLHNCTGLVKVKLNTQKKLNPIIYVANGCDIVIEGVAINSPKPMVYTINCYGDNTVKTVSVDMVEYKIVKHDTK